MKLTAEQELIRHHVHGPALVLAVAGSGKTTALRHRVQNLVESGHARASEILLTSFNVKNRIDLEEAMVQHASTAGVTCKTLNGLGHTIMQEAHRRGHLPHMPQVLSLNVGHFYDACDVARAMDVEWKNELWDADPDNFLSYVDECLNNFNYDQKPLHLPEWMLNQVHWENPTGLEIEWYPELYRIMMDLLREQNAITYTHQHLIGWELLSMHRDLQRYFQERWKFIAVDEAQDLNLVQYRLLEILSFEHRNLMLVGDDDQTIYSWRGANSSLMVGFPENHDAAVYSIETNFRCPAEQLAIASNVIRHNRERIPKELRLSQGFKGAVTLEKGNSAWEQAVGFINKVLEHRDRFSYNDMVVLIRTWGQAGVLEAVLSETDIPFEIAGPGSLGDSKESRIAQGWLLLAEIEAAWQSGQQPFELIDEVRPLLKPMLQLPKLFANAEWSRRFMEEMTSTPPSALLRNLSRELRYQNVARVHDYANLLEAAGKHLHKTNAYDYLTRWLHIADLASTVRHTYSRPDKAQECISRFQAAVNLAQKRGSIPSYRDYLENFRADNHVTTGDRILITSMHRAKGLEWPVVFLHDVSAEQIPLSTKDSYGDDSIDEDARLFYVAMTRSKEYTHIFHGPEPSLFLKGASSTLELVRSVQTTLETGPRNATDRQVLEFVHGTAALHYWEYLGLELEPDAMKSWQHRIREITERPENPLEVEDYDVDIFAWGFWDVIKAPKLPARDKRGNLVQSREPTWGAKPLETAAVPEYPIGSIWHVDGAEMELIDCFEAKPGVFELVFLDESGSKHYKYSHVHSNQLKRLPPLP